MMLGRGEMLSLFLFLAGQTIAGIWWASRLTTTLNFLAEALKLIEGRMSGTGYARCQVHDERMKQLDARLFHLETRLDSLEDGRG